MNYRNSYTSFAAAFALLFAVFSASVLTGCDSTTNINNPPEQPFDGTGTVTGRVIDRVTDAPIEGATVRIDVADTLVATTGADGAFSFEGVPANRSEAGGSASGTYNVHVSTPDGSPYRDFYTAEVELVFGSTDGVSGPGNNLAASVTFELAKLNGTINGALTTTSDFSGEEIGVAGQELVLFQTDFSANDVAEGDAGSNDTQTVRLTSTTTADDGTFSFESVEEDGSFDIRAVTQDGSLQSVETVALDPSTTGSTTTLSPIQATFLPDFKAELFYVEDGSLVPFTEDADLSTGTPEFRLVFSQPVAENAYTTPDPDATGDNIAKDIFIDGSPTEKDIGTDFARTDNGDIAVNVSFSSARDTLSISPVDPLPDGAEYRLDLSGVLESGEGFVSEAFEQAISGLQPGNTTSQSFSTGINQDAPAAPSVAFNTDDGTAPDFDYTAFSVNVPLTLSPGAADGPELEGYRIFVRTADTDDQAGFGDDEYEEFEEIDLDDFDTPFSDAIDITGGTNDNDPFHDDEGNYEPIEWRFVAVSLNGVESEATEVVLGDSVGVQLNSAFFVDQDEDFSNDEAVVVNIDEPIPSISVGDSGADFISITDGDDDEDEDPTVGDVLEVNTTTNGTTVTVAVSGGTQETYTIRIENLEDLAGNGVDADADEGDDFYFTN